MNSPADAESAGFNSILGGGKRYEQYPISSDIAERVFVIPASLAECENHFCSFNSRLVITSQLNIMFPETVEALAVVLGNITISSFSSLPFFVICLNNMQTLTTFSQKATAHTLPHSSIMGIGFLI